MYECLWFIMSPLYTQKGRHIGLRLTTHFYVTSVLCLCVGEDAVDIKNRFHHIKIHSLYLSTIQSNYLVTLITQAIDTTSNSYQPLWLRCWRGDIFIFLCKKNRLF